MALTFAGLLFVQILYMKNMIRMRDDQFAEGVKRSIYGVAVNLEQDETKYYLEEDIAQIETSVLPRYSTGGSDQEGIKFSFTTAEGKKGALTFQGDKELTSELTHRKPTPSTPSKQELLRDQYLYQKGLMDEVILRMISQTNLRPITERADSTKVATYLKMELANNGINIPFEFAIVNRIGAPFYTSGSYRAFQTTETEMYDQLLFPYDNQKRQTFLRIYFPDKRDYILSSVKYIIPALVLTFILLVTFVYTIFLTFRQKKLTEMKNDFINNMTHEFKTPISTISLAAQMLNDGSVRKSDKMLEHISTVINDETKRLRFQVEKVLQMSMFERQKATLKLEDIDANQVIDNIIHTFKIKVEKYGGKIDSSLDASDAIINVDEMHFTNVIFNLLDNAVKYRREEEPLMLRVSTKDLPNSKLQITVEDNGIGIKKEDLKKIFDKFYRVSTGNRHDVKGFGLGLAYVKKMVMELGGEITVESEPNEGTKFIIILPLTKN